MPSIDLQIKPSKLSDKPKPYYPSIEVNGEFEVGDEVVIKGTVTRCIEDDNGCRCTVECQKAESEDEEEGLEGAMKKIAKKKVKASEDNDE